MKKFFDCDTTLLSSVVLYIGDPFRTYQFFTREVLPRLATAYFF